MSALGRSREGTDREGEDTARTVPRSVSGVWFTGIESGQSPSTKPEDRIDFDEVALRVSSVPPAPMSEKSEVEKAFRFPFVAPDNDSTGRTLAEAPRHWPLLIVLPWMLLALFGAVVLMWWPRAASSGSLVMPRGSIDDAPSANWEAPSFESFPIAPPVVELTEPIRIRTPSAGQGAQAVPMVTAAPSIESTSAESAPEGEPETLAAPSLPSEPSATTDEDVVAEATEEPIRFEEDFVPYRPSQTDIRTALQAVRARVVACTPDSGVAVLRMVVVGETGRVVSAEAAGTYAGTEAGQCMVRAVETARFPRFGMESIALTFPFQLRGRSDTFDVTSTTPAL